MSEADTVSDPIETYERGMRGMNDSTLAGHLSRARQFSEWLGDEKTVLEADVVDVREWLLDLYDDGKGHQGSTIDNYHGTLKSFYDAFTDDVDEKFVPTVLDDNPARFDFDTHLSSVSTTPKKQQIADNDEGIIHLQPDEIRKLRANVPDPKARNELIIKMFVQTGMRATELANLKYSDEDADGESHIKRDKQIIKVPDSKNDKTRTVPYDDLDPELSLWLDEGYRAQAGMADESEYLFPTDESEHISERQIGHIVREAAENADDIQEVWDVDAAGRKKRRITTHSLRATFVIRLFKAGLPANEIQKLTGHAELETLNSYAKAARQGAVNSYRNADIEFGIE